MPDQNMSAFIPGKDATPAHTAAYCGILTALAMIFSYVEALIPVHFGIPGIKLGLANLVVLSGLYYLRPGMVLMISAARIVLTGLLFGNGVSILYSLAGGMLSYAVMMITLLAGGFSPAGVSVAGGVSHNIGQLLVAAIVLQTPVLIRYLPVLLAAGTVAGLLMGMLTMRVMRALHIPY